MGAATITASAVLIAPSVQPPPLPKPTIQLTASSQVLQQEPGVLQQLVSGDITGFLGGVIIPPGFGTPPPAPPTIPPAPVPSSVASFINNAYLAIEPWVSYGFEVGAWAFSWVPWIGWLAPQIWPIGYNFGEALVRSAVFNFTDWLQGDGGVIENVVDWGVESFDALVQFGVDQWNFWIGFPLPPLPGGLAAPQTTTLMGLTTTSLDAANPAAGLLDGVTAPIKNGIGFGTGVLRDALDGLAPGIAKQADRQNVEQAVEAAGSTTLTTRIEERVNQAAETATGQDSVGNGVVRAQGEVRDAVTKTVSDVTNTLRGGKPGKAGEDATTTPASVVKSLGDTTKKAVNDVQQTAKNSHGAAKNRHAAGGNDQ
ncbi:MAG TPA: hypothetical protein VHT50_03150 [Mycobacterium sp.]|nr:hypothetical protein [Mycobacterium sp.]